MNIVLIIIDTLRYDAVGANGNPDIRTPNIDRLAAEAWSFDRAFAASYPTIPHRTDVQTGRYGSPFHAWQPLPFDVPTLPRALSEAGYATQLIHDTPHLVNGGHNFDWPFHAWTPVRGAEVDRPRIVGKPAWLPNWTFDPLFDCLGDTRDLDRMDWRLAAYAAANRGRANNDDWNSARLFDTASEFLKDNAGRDNFFLWLDGFDPHEPWDAPPEFVRLYDGTPGYDGTLDPRAFWQANRPELGDAAHRRIRAQYLAKVSWMDHCLGRFLDMLDETGLAKRTTVILTADHGTQLRERGAFYKGYPLHDSEARLPLIIRAPERDSGRSDALVQPQDISATIAALAGTALPAPAEGQDVLSLARHGNRGFREIAISGAAPGPQWQKGPAMFTAFRDDWCLTVAPTPEASELCRLGSVDPVSDREDVVQDLHAAALAELERREPHPALMAWLRAGAAAPLPDCPLHAFWPRPPGYQPYFMRLYGHEAPWKQS